MNCAAHELRCTEGPVLSEKAMAKVTAVRELERLLVEAECLGYLINCSWLMEYVVKMLQCNMTPKLVIQA